MWEVEKVRSEPTPEGLWITGATKLETGLALETQIRDYPQPPEEVMEREHLGFFKTHFSVI